MASYNFTSWILKKKNSNPSKYFYISMQYNYLVSLHAVGSCYLLHSLKRTIPRHSTCSSRTVVMCLCRYFHTSASHAVHRMITFNVSSTSWKFSPRHFSVSDMKEGRVVCLVILNEQDPAYVSGLSVAFRNYSSGRKLYQFVIICCVRTVNLLAPELFF